MNDESAFLNALQSNYQDVTSRLVYADWLEEHGDARSEYLRLEAEADRLQARLQQLRQQLDPAWLMVVSPHYLRYTPAYHLHCELPLRSGRMVTLQRLEQARTYEGLLAGTPDREMNEDIIERALRDAGGVCLGGTRPHLIPPPRRDYERTPGDMEQLVAEWPHHVPEWLPRVRCIGRFKDVAPARDPTKFGSELTLVWFQDEYALPIQEPALSQIRSLDWEALATDMDFD